MRHLLFLGITLAALWVSLSGFFTPLMLGFGAISIALVLWISHRMDVVDHEGHPVHLRPFRLASFWLWQLKEIVISNFTVARIIASPKLVISPTITKVNVGNLSVVGQVTYANSVTLTPGSLTMELAPNGDATIHTLTRETAKELSESSLGQHLQRVEEGWQEEDKA